MITYNENAGQFQLDTKSSSYVMQVREGFLLHLYWGEKLDTGDHSYMRWEQGRAAFSPRLENCEGFILDDLPLEYPCFGRGDLRSPALEVINPDGSNICDLRYASHTITEGKPVLPGLPAFYTEDGDSVQTLVITLRDEISKIECELYYTVYDAYGIIARRAVIRNAGENTRFIKAAASACVDFDNMDFDIISNYGTHARERMTERFPMNHGKFELASRRGASGHVHNPFMIMTSHNADEDHGDVYGVLLVYSGSHSISAEGTQFNAARMLAGINPDGFSWKLESGEEFSTPEAVLCHTNEGITKLSHMFHAAINDRLIRGKYKNSRRPVLLNSWEACYFSFDESRLLKIGKCAADLGIELLVIDDGWFGKRDSDNCSLGDWVIDRRKLPNGLDKIYNLLKENDCTLGIWFEPEMVSPDSDLYRAHPDWCLHIENRPRSEGRHQLMLNLSRPEVCDYLYDSIAAVLKTGMIAYVKWDFNRNMAEVGSEALPYDRQGEVSHRYYIGLYSLLERLVTDFPDVLFESCSGGGGRFDAGMLYYMPQTWTSDNSDAIERLKIQYGTSLVYPMSAMSAHVSASPNHQTAHVTDFETRFTVAFTGSFGYELDPTSLSDEDKEMVVKTSELYKKYGHVMVTGDYYRLRNNYEEDCAAWCTVSPDKSVCVAGYVNTHVRMYDRNERLKLKGIDKNAVYRDVLNGNTYSGAQLSGFGLPVHITLEYRSAMWILEKI
ncbi:MAG: alpha-galactosidase [Eubacteriales bacterium]|nr:alpha-galactosidase [Eubacteriales bacterium]